MPKDSIRFTTTLTIHPQAVGELQESAIWRIPWGHHRYIIDKFFNAPEKAMFFVKKHSKMDGAETYY